MSLMITGYREQPKMGPMPKSSTTANTTRSITVRGPSQSNASLAISSPRMGPMPPSNYQPRSAPVSLTVGSRTPEAVPNKNVERFSQGSFGVGKEYDRYTNMFQRQIDEGSTLERSMYLSRTATPQDHINAFGNRDNWRTWTGGNKMGSGGAAVNAARRAQKARRDAQRNNAFSIPSLNNVLMAGDNRGLNRQRDYDVNTGDLKGITTDSDFGRRMREAMYGSPPKA